MLNLFGLGRQHDALFGAVKKLEPHKQALVDSRLFDCRLQLRKTDDALKSFNYVTKTLMSKLMSFMPFTKEFRFRTACAIEINKSRKMIDSMSNMESYKNEEKQDKVRIVSDELFDPRRPTSPSLPIHYHSVIGVGRNHFQELRHRQRSRSPSPERELKQKGANNKYYGHYI